MATYIPINLNILVSSVNHAINRVDLLYIPVENQNLQLLWNYMIKLAIARRIGIYFRGLNGDELVIHEYHNIFTKRKSETTTLIQEFITNIGWKVKSSKTRFDGTITKLTKTTDSPLMTSFRPDQKLVIVNAWTSTVIC